MNFSFILKLKYNNEQGRHGKYLAGKDKEAAVVKRQPTAASLGKDAIVVL